MTVIVMSDEYPEGRRVDLIEKTPNECKQSDELDFIPYIYGLI